MMMISKKYDVFLLYQDNFRIRAIVYSLRKNQK